MLIRLAGHYWHPSQAADTTLCVCVMVGAVRRCRFEYESSDSSREEMKRKFAHTMEFVEEYLRDVVSQPYPFGDKDKNELTLEVRISEPDVPAQRLSAVSSRSLLLKAFRTPSLLF